MSASDEQKAQILALLETDERLSSNEIAERVGVGKMVVAGHKANLTKKHRRTQRPKATVSSTPSAKRLDYRGRVPRADKTEKWAVTMAKVGIRQAVVHAPWPRWQFATFCGPHGGEARGIVDLIAVRKDHGGPPPRLKRGDALRIDLIQIKGGHAAMPTDDDCRRLRTVKRLYSACQAILATWKKGEAAHFFSLRPKPKAATGVLERNWEQVRT